MEKSVMKTHCDWIREQAMEIKACLNLKESDIKLNAARELSAISTAMYSLRELEAYFKEIMEV